MTCVRLRDLPDPDELARVYAQPHNHRDFGRGHSERVNKMIELGRDVVGHVRPRPMRVADLSCGNGVVATSLTNERDTVLLGDIAPGWPLHGPIEQTITAIDRVDMFIMGETLEHLDDPVAVLKQVARKTDYLLASTPTENWGDTNAEHLWAWDWDYLEETMLRNGYLDVVAHDVVDSRQWGEPYRYDIWVAITY